MANRAVTVFELVGGQPFLDALADAFYERVESTPESPKSNLRQCPACGAGH